MATTDTHPAVMADSGSPSGPDRTWYRSPRSPASRLATSGAAARPAGTTRAQSCWICWLWRALNGLDRAEATPADAGAALRTGHHQVPGSGSVVRPPDTREILGLEPVVAQHPRHHATPEGSSLGSTPPALIDASGNPAPPGSQWRRQESDLHQHGINPHESGVRAERRLLVPQRHLRMVTTPIASAQQDLAWSGIEAKTCRHRLRVLGGEPGEA